MKLQFVHRKRFYPILLLTLIMALLLAAGAFAAPTTIIILDDYDQDQTRIDLTYPADLNVPQSLGVECIVGTCIGGFRKTEAEIIGGSTDGNKFSVAVSGGNMTLSSESTIQGRSQLTYDGTSNTGSLNCTGLDDGVGGPGYDLTSGGTQNGFEFNIISLDIPMDTRARFYDVSDATCNTWTEILFVDFLPDQPGPAYLPFPAFMDPTTSGRTVGPNGPLSSFEVVGAIEFEFLPDANADLTLGNAETAELDYGDLPDSFLTTYASDGARHVLGTLKLGSGFDPDDTIVGEGDGQPTVNADGDDTHGDLDDEDGVTRVQSPNATSPAMWTNGTGGGRVEVVVTGGSGYLVGWFDFNYNGTFELAELAIQQTVTAGTNVIDFDIPAGTFDGTTTPNPLYARFRLFETEPTNLGNSYFGQAVNGEVEDYLWDFGPNAVTLSHFEAAGASIPLVGFTALAAITLIMAVASLTVGWRRR